MKKTIFLLSVSLLVFAAACSKKESNPNSTKSYPDIAGKNVKQILMMQDWKLTFWADSAENETKWIDQTDECMLGNIFSFNGDGTYKVTYNNKACDPDGFYIDDYIMSSDNSTMVTFFDGNEWELKYKSNTQLLFWRIVNGTEQHFQKVILIRP